MGGRVLDSLSAIEAEGSGRAGVFCGGTPVTSEHVWPQWIAKYLPHEKAEHYRLSESAEGREIERRGFREQESVWRMNSSSVELTTPSHREIEPARHTGILDDTTDRTGVL